MKPKQKWWTVKKQDVGREVGNPDWVDWAVKRIADLESQLAQREWISVEDRLPEEHGPVLVSDGINVWDQAYCSDGFGWQTSSITHWQSLPAPPKEADND